MGRGDECLMVLGRQLKAQDMHSKEHIIRHQASVTRSYKFCAAHRLHVAELSNDVNQKIFGKCNNANGHGHSYTVLVTITGDMDSKSGHVTDLDHLDRVVHEKIVQRFDHRHLNYDPAFREVNPTGENVVRFVWDELVSEITQGHLAKVGVIETRDNYFEYRGDVLEGKL